MIPYSSTFSCQCHKSTKNVNGKDKQFLWLKGLHKYVVPSILKGTSSEILKWQFVTRAQILLGQWTLEFNFKCGPKELWNHSFHISDFILYWEFFQTIRTWIVGQNKALELSILSVGYDCIIKQSHKFLSFLPICQARKWSCNFSNVGNNLVGFVKPAWTSFMSFSEPVVQCQCDHVTLKLNWHNKWTAVP